MLPKKKKPITNKMKKNFQTLEILDKELPRPDAPKKESGEKTEKLSAPRQSRKMASATKWGRPSPIANRTERFTLHLSEKTAERFNLSFPREQQKQKKQGKKIDKSLIIELALVAWLDKNNY